jgi:hypothetical protein
MQKENNNKEQQELRIIKTARSEKAINEAVEQGFWPLVKPVIPSPDISVKFAVTQNKNTGKITVVNDFRLTDIPLVKPVAEFSPPLQQDVKDIDPIFPIPEYVTRDVDAVPVIEWTFYYPYNFESPFAAYLVPPDLQVGEIVMLEDLIEDEIGGEWNQGDTYRLASCMAIWDGKEFILQLDPDRIRVMRVG